MNGSQESTATTIQVENIDHFIQLLAAWHERKVQILEHMLTVPDGTPVSLDEGEEEPLTGDLRRGFLMGLNVALSELGTLPFAAEGDGDTEEPYFDPEVDAQLVADSIAADDAR